MLERFFTNDLQGEDDTLKHLRHDGDVVGKVKISKYVMTNRHTKDTRARGANSNPIDWL